MATSNTAFSRRAYYAVATGRRVARGGKGSRRARVWTAAANAARSLHPRQFLLQLLSLHDQPDVRRGQVLWLRARGGAIANVDIYRSTKACDIRTTRGCARACYSR